LPFVTSGIRVGTPAATTRGFGTAEIAELTGWMCDVMDSLDGDKADAAVVEKIRGQVSDLCRRFPVYGD